jgi:hypothetical protein
MLMMTMIFLSWSFNDTFSIETVQLLMIKLLMSVKQLVEWELAGETELLGEKFK